MCKEYLGKRPVIIPYHKGGKRLHIGFQVGNLAYTELWKTFLSLSLSHTLKVQEFTEDLAARSQAIMDHLNFVKVSSVILFKVDIIFFLMSTAYLMVIFVHTMIFCDLQFRNTHMYWLLIS